jgi:spermidine synthase
LGCQDFQALAFQRFSTVRTPYQRVEVWKKTGSCELRVAGAAHAVWQRDCYLTGLAWDNLAAGALLRPGGPPESVLMFGLAGGTAMRILRHLLPECRFTAVDIDEQMVELAREHMHLDELRIEAHIADAYQWAGECRERYDVIIDDCYLAGEEDVFRPEKTPGRGVEVCRKLLAPGGLLVANLLTGAGHGRMQSRTRAAFRRSFPAVSSVTTPESETEGLVGGSHVLTSRALAPWTDRFKGMKDREYWGWLASRELK